ncbi:MAG: metal ABC transporter permease [Actinobacteria bacterium]|uniref:High-affinity zinc uptake system membrane protein ZnuB n=1 Tax=freshwater metagenome TaxID=449393 RepID=A0A6J5Z489_9ZZZZ|nr:metal ABC transporter permease [Actinomycetota bacterium]
MSGWLLEPLREPVVLRSLIELALIGLVAGTLGCWIVLAGRSYSAESLAHSMLPGLVGAALLGLPLVLGGAVGLAVGASLIALVGRIKVLDGEVAVSVVITSLFGAGVLLGLAPATPAGLNGLLFGDLLAVGLGEIAIAAAYAAVVLVVLFALHEGLLVAGFDRLNARALGRAPAPFDLVLALLLAGATLVAVQALGNLLVVAMLVGPAATARLLSKRIGPMMLIGVAVAWAASLAGLYASYHADLAAGASVTCALVIAFAAALLARTLRETIAANGNRRKGRGGQSRGLRLRSRRA